MDIINWKRLLLRIFMHNYTEIKTKVAHELCLIIGTNKNKKVLNQLFDGY